MGKDKECFQTERTPYLISAGCDHRVSPGLLLEDTAANRTGQSLKRVIHSEAGDCLGLGMGVQCRPVVPKLGVGTPSGVPK